MGGKKCGKEYCLPGVAKLQTTGAKGWNGRLRTYCEKTSADFREGFAFCGPTPVFLRKSAETAHCKGIESNLAYSVSTKSVQRKDSAGDNSMNRAARGAKTLFGWTAGEMTANKMASLGGSR
jgi:hypothetical protein